MDNLQPLGPSLVLATRGGQSPFRVGLPASAAKTAYLIVTIGAGTIVALASVRDLNATDYGLRWLVFAGLTIVGGFARLRVPNVPASFSISDGFTIAAALLFGPAGGVLAVVIDTLAISVQLARRKFVLERFLFNVTAPALAMWVTAHAFFALAGVGPLAGSTTPLTGLLGPLMVFAGLYFVLNTGLIAAAITLERRTALLDTWRRHFLSLWLSYFGGAVVAALLIALVNARGDDVIVYALIAPIPIILYAAFKNAVGRMEDRFAHLEQVNRMYLSTIEALATAIEAKDGVTHDHLRRVQRYAVALADALKVTDEKTIKAIEAAALLHDTGKLAVPEHILNKPARLTPAEFETIKRHVEVGTDILSAIDFPYPVVAIVRSHHEAWDGSGYPRGLRGTEIPIGARILSVVDCFDALTSNRPYRRALSDEGAIRILMAGRGTRYDPDIVDAFVQMHPSLRAQLPRTVPHPDDCEQTEVVAACEVTPDVHVQAARRGSEGQIPSLPPASAPDAAPDLVAFTATLLQHVLPEASYAFYVVSADDELILCHAAGALAPALRGFRMALNEGVSGWVATNRLPIVNSDAALDLGTLDLPPVSRRCWSTPLLAEGTLVGVLTVYTESPAVITDDQARLLQNVAPHVAAVLQRDSQFAGGIARLHSHPFAALRSVPATHAGTSHSC